MMGFNLQLGDALRSESVTAIDDAIREIVRQEIDRTPRTKFCDACAYMHQPEISARCCCVACHGDDVPAWAQRMNVTTPLSSEKTGEGRSASGSTGARTSVACDPSLPTPAPSPASPVKPCPWCGEHPWTEYHNGETYYRCGDSLCPGSGFCLKCKSRGGWMFATWNRRAPAPFPASGEGAKTVLDNVLEYAMLLIGITDEKKAAARTELASLRASAESAPMPTREREEILKNDEIALAIADGMARCADVFCDQAQPDRRREAARMTHKRLADSRELLAAVHADVVRLRSALAEKEKAGVDVSVRDVLAERAKQRAKWTEAHDDGHGDASLAAAAAVLAHPESEGLFGPEWSFDLREKRPHERERCVVAAALLLAEIERLDRRTALGAKDSKEGK